VRGFLLLCLAPLHGERAARLPARRVAPLLRPPPPVPRAAVTRIRSRRRPFIVRPDEPRPGPFQGPAGADP